VLEDDATGEIALVPASQAPSHHVSSH
jgi:hypothetical protein